MADSAQGPSHVTTRRGFIAATGFGVLGLYLLWAAYGAAPLVPAGHEEPAEPAGGGGHGGEHGAGPSGPSAGEFRRLTEAFVEAHRQPDGSVRPRRTAAPAVATEDHGGHGAGHALTEDAYAARDGEPVDVYLMAYQWGYTPAVLRLEAGVAYRFRMMAIDVAHGASLQLGHGGRIVRLRPSVLVEHELTFTRPGEYLLYCTVYCGLPHDRMQGRIVVAAQEARP
jgi:plastocyanin